MVFLFWPETKGISLEHMDQIFGEVDKVDAFAEEYDTKSAEEGYQGVGCEEGSTLVSKKQIGTRAFA